MSKEYTVMIDIEWCVVNGNDPFKDDCGRIGQTYDLGTFDTAEKAVAFLGFIEEKAREYPDGS